MWGMIVVWMAVTAFGDSAAMVPAALLIGLWLALDRAWRQAALWSLCFGVAVLLVAATKIAFLGWGIGIGALDFTGVSGHTTLSVSVLSVGASISLRDQSRPLRMAGIACAALAGIAIGLSRVVLHFHSVSEVAFGAALGAGVTSVFLMAGRPAATGAEGGARLQPAVLGLLIVILMMTVHGRQAPTQTVLTRIALALSGRSVPYGRTVPLAAPG